MKNTTSNIILRIDQNQPQIRQRRGLNHIFGRQSSGKHLKQQKEKIIFKKFDEDREFGDNLKHNITGVPEGEENKGLKF